MFTLQSLLILAMAFSTPASAQVCQPRGITLNSQEEVDNFQLNHGPCDRAAALNIEGSDITNLDGLSALTEVGTLEIQFNGALTNVNGLSALTSVAFNLLIRENAALTNLDGLSALTSVGKGLYIIDV